MIFSILNIFYFKMDTSLEYELTTSEKIDRLRCYFNFVQHLINKYDIINYDYENEFDVPPLNEIEEILNHTKITFF